MTETLRVGIVGATARPVGSRWGANAHVPALNALPGYELAAVCTAHEESAKASAEEFGAPLAFHDFDEMVNREDIDLVSVVVRVPSHHDLVMSALRAGKAVLCEWPFAANLAEAEEMGALAKEQSARTAVGLQARSDPVFRHARELLQQGEIGEVVAASLKVVAPNDVERPAPRMWQGQRSLGANPLTIAGGHALDALCFLLGEFTAVSGRVSTRIREWRDTETGAAVPVDAPDVVGFAGSLENDVEVAGQVASVPASPPGYLLEIFGRDGNLQLSGGFVSGGPNELAVARGREAPAPVKPPAELSLVPADLPPGPARNVAQAYARFASALSQGQPFDPDFDQAVRRHRLIDAIERSSEDGAVVTL